MLKLRWPIIGTENELKCVNRSLFKNETSSTAYNTHIFYIIVLYHKFSRSRINYRKKKREKRNYFVLNFSFIL